MPKKRRKKTEEPIVEEPVVEPELVATEEPEPEVVVEEPEPTPTAEDELKTLKKTVRKIIKEKPVLFYPEESKLQLWLKKLEAAVK
jgi:hypothetical protein